MTVYYRKRKALNPPKRGIIRQTDNLLTRGISFVKGFLKEKIEEAGDNVERELDEKFKDLKGRLK